MWPAAAWRTAGRWGGYIKSAAVRWITLALLLAFRLLTLTDPNSDHVSLLGIRSQQRWGVQTSAPSCKHEWEHWRTIRGFFPLFSLYFFFPVKHISIAGGLLVHLQHNQAYPDILIVVFHHPVIYRTRQMGRWLPSCKRTPPVAHRHRPRWRSLRRGAEAAAVHVRLVHQPGDPQQRTFLPSDLHGWFGQLKLVPHRCGECFQSRRRRRMERVSELREGG